MKSKKEEFKAYINFEQNYTPILNILNEDLEFFTKLGHYLYKKGFNKTYKIFDSPSDKSARMMAIMFFTSILDKKEMSQMFGDPIRHHKFGEGTFYSYFIELEGVKLHIGIDNRGTGIEYEVNTSAAKLEIVLRKLVDLFNNIILNND